MFLRLWPCSCGGAEEARWGRSPTPGAKKETGLSREDSLPGLHIGSLYACDFSRPLTDCEGVCRERRRWRRVPWLFADTYSTGVDEVLLETFTMKTCTQDVDAVQQLLDFLVDDKHSEIWVSIARAIVQRNTANMGTGTLNHVQGFFSKTSLGSGKHRRAAIKWARVGRMCLHVMPALQPHPALNLVPESTDDGDEKT